MTYTFKLARRLAILRDFAMLTVLALLVGCAGDPTAPDAGPVSGNAPQTFRVIPSAVTIETNQPIRFRGQVRAFRGELVSTRAHWEASGGLIDTDGNFTATEPGTYKVVGKGRYRNKADTSVVVVVPPQPDLVRVAVTPGSLSLTAAATQPFTAVGVLSDSSTAPIGVTWHATGGSIDPSGLYTAGTAGGSFRVVATSTDGTLADTAAVSVTASAEPAPEPAPAPALAQVVLKPASVTLATGASRQFAVYGVNSVGDSVLVQVAFTATGGSVTGGGLYTAGTAPGTYRVIATAAGLADTALVTLATTGTTGTTGSTGATGIPFGPYGAWDGTTLKSNTAVFTGSINSVNASALVTRITEARSKGMQLMTAMTGGHDPYLTDGVFDMAKWKARMDTYNTPTIRQAVAAAVADGTIIGNSVMDEPHVYGLGDGNTWGPQGTMTKARVDSMCGYVKAIFPTLPVGVVHQHHVFEPTKSYKVCEFIVDQYSLKYGDVYAFRDAGLALAKRDGIAIAFSLNILNGGIQAARDGQWNCPLTTTAGRGTFDPNCRMTPAQVREFGLTLGTAGCAMMMWRYDDAFMANSENQRAFADIASRLATQPARACRRI
jgi:hypothetical protein